MVGAISNGQIVEYIGRRGSLMIASIPNIIGWLAISFAKRQSNVKKKKLYEQELEKLGNFKLRIHEQMMLLEGAEINFETVAALRTGASTTRATQKEVKINDIEQTMTGINKQAKKMRQIQEIISTPIGATANFDEDELEAELEELEDADLEEMDVLQPMSKTLVTPARAVPVGKQSSRKTNIFFPTVTSTTGNRVWGMTQS